MINSAFRLLSIKRSIQLKYQIFVESTRILSILSSKYDENTSVVFRAEQSAQFWYILFSYQLCMRLNTIRNMKEISYCHCENFKTIITTTTLSVVDCRVQFKISPVSFTYKFYVCAICRLMIFHTLLLLLYCFRKWEKNSRRRNKNNTIALSSVLAAGVDICEQRIAKEEE